MKTFKVRNETGQEFDVEETNLSEAEADGYLPVVSNGSQSFRVSSSEISKAEKDGFRPLSNIKVDRDITKTQSAIRGAAQGISFGFADEIAGAAESLLTDKDYSTARDESRAAFKAAEDANPYSYLAGELGAGIAIPLPGVGLLKTGSTAAKIGKSAVLGAGIGAATGAGQAEEEVAQGAATGAAGGAVLGGAFGAAGSLLGRLGKEAKSVNIIDEMGDAYKYGTEGINIRGKDNAIKLQEEGRDFAQEVFNPSVIGLNSAKNNLYAEATALAKAEGKTVNVKNILEKIDEIAKSKNLDPKTTQALKKDLNDLAGLKRVETTDPEILAQQQSEIVENVKRDLSTKYLKTYETQANKVASSAKSTAESTNKQFINEVKKYLKQYVVRENISDEALEKQARDILSKQGKLIDPEAASQKALAELQNSPNAKVDIKNVLGVDVLNIKNEAANIAQQVPLSPLMDDGAKALAGQAGLEKLAAKSVNREQQVMDAARKQADILNQKNVRAYAKSLSDEGVNDSLALAEKEFINSTDYIDPDLAAQNARRLFKDKPDSISFETKTDATTGLDVVTLTSDSIGEISKVIPNRKLYNLEYTNPELGPDALNKLMSKSSEKSQALYRSGDGSKIDEARALGDASRQYKSIWETFADAGKLNEAKNVNAVYKNSTAELGPLAQKIINTRSNDPADVINAADETLRLFMSSNEAATSAIADSVNLKKFVDKIQQLPDDLPEKQKILSSFDGLTEKARKAYLARQTFDASSLALDPTSVIRNPFTSFYLSAKGKTISAANIAGQAVDGTKKMLPDFVKSKVNAVNSMPANKRKAAMFVLLQQPDVRKAASDAGVDIKDLLIPGEEE